MRLPRELAEAIQAEIEKVERRLLVQAAREISARYQAGDFSSPALATDAQRAAYLAVRFPATYAACRRVFSEIRLRAPQAEIAGMLDLGAGPGTALLAAGEIFPALRRASLIDLVANRRARRPAHREAFQPEVRRRHAKPARHR